MQRLILLIFVLFFVSGNACDCPPPKQLNEQRINSYTTIVWGKVISVNPCKGNATARFRVDEIYKGTVSKEILIEFDCSSSCMMNFNNGEEWIIYGQFLRPDRITVSGCSESRKYLKKKEDDMSFFLSGKTFEEECEWLRKNCGVKPYFTQGNEQLHFNEKPNRMQILWLIGISVLTLVTLIFVFKKWLR